MSPLKQGRPPKENARKGKLNLRLSDAELAEIQEVADALKTTRTDAILTAIRFWKQSSK